MFKWLNSVRSLIAILVTITFCYMAVISKVDPKDVVTIVGMLIVFYFTKDRSKLN